MSSSYQGGCTALDERPFLRNLEEKDVFELPHGVVVVRNYLNEDEQLGVMLDLFDVVDPHSLRPNTGGRHTPLLMYNWPASYKGDTPSSISFSDDDAGRKLNRFPTPSRHTKSSSTESFLRPQSVLDFGRLAFQKIQSHAEIRRFQCSSQSPDRSVPRHLRVPSHEDNYSPNALYAIMYPGNGSLEAHQDMFMGWVLSLSLGAPCRFFYQKALEDEPVCLTLHSGDLMLFNGGKLFHGVSEIVTSSHAKGHMNEPAAGTTAERLELEDSSALPEFWTHCHNSGILPTEYVRMNVQFRDAKFMRNFERLHKNEIPVHNEASHSECGAGGCGAGGCGAGGCGAGGCGAGGCGVQRLHKNEIPVHNEASHSGCGTGGCGTNGCRAGGCGAGGCGTGGLRQVRQHSDGKQASAMSAFGRDMRRAMAASLRTMNHDTPKKGTHYQGEESSDSDWEE